MKITKQLIAVTLVCTGVFTGMSQSTPPATTPRAEDSFAGGGGGGRGGGGLAPTRAASPAPAAGVYAQNVWSDGATAYGYVSSSKSSGSSVPPVVIQFGSKSPEAIADMEEHLAIMTHIIDGALDRMGDDVPDEKMGIKLYYTSGGKSVRALYLENFGPLFMVKVNFPVHAPAVAEAKAPEEPDDSEWNRARQSVFGSEDVRWTGVSGGMPYEAERVEALKKQLVAALKNASNMKGVKPEEYVTVTVFGSPAAVNGEAVRERRSSSNGSSSSTSSSSRGAAPTSARAGVVVERNKVTQLDSARASSHGTVLTMRLKKADIDAAGKDVDALAKKVIVNTYAGNGHGLSSVNSWIKSSPSSSVRAR